VGADQRRAGAAEPSSTRARHHAHGSHHRLAKRQNGAKRGQRGYDAGKRIKGRKRHIAVDRSGHLLAAVVHGADVQDSAGARLLLPHLSARYPTVGTVYADGGYQGKLLDWARGVLGMQMKIIKRTMPKGFQVLPKRWVVERTLAWLGWNRRLSKDYELNPKSSECFLFLAAAMVLLRRIP
jgi:putative transposase